MVASMTMLITKLINAARDDLQQMDGREIALSCAAGVSGVCSSNPSGAITYEYPDGRKVTLSRCQDREVTS
jgi:protein-L-isoaspartate O-methyltransferase